MYNIWINVQLFRHRFVHYDVFSKGCWNIITYIFKRKKLKCCTVQHPFPVYGKGAGDRSRFAETKLSDIEKINVTKPHTGTSKTSAPLMKKPSRLREGWVGSHRPTKNLHRTNQRAKYDKNERNPHKVRISPCCKQDIFFRHTAKDIIQQPPR